MPIWGDKMKKVVIILLAVVVVGGAAFFALKAGRSNSLASLGYSVSQAQTPFQNNGWTQYKESTVRKKNVDPKLLTGKAVTKPISVKDSSVLKQPDFYKSILYSEVIDSGDITVNSFTAKVKQPFANVFYIHDTSTNSDKKDYVVVFVPNDKDKTMTIYTFTVNPSFMDEAVNSTLKPFIERFKIEKR